MSEIITALISIAAAFCGDVLTAEGRIEGFGE